MSPGDKGTDWHQIHHRKKCGVQMIDIAICDRDPVEAEMIRQDCKQQVACRSEQDLRIEKLRSAEGLVRLTEQEQTPDMVYCDFQAGDSVSDLRDFRAGCRNAMLMLVTDASVSPLEYLRPGVSPDALMLRPLEQELLQQINGEFIDSYLERVRRETGEERFYLSTREEKTCIPFSSIYYFEAREKKLYVRTRREEYPFYDTIEALSGRLPDCFSRCHRSYIVNRQKILRVVTGESLIELSGGMRLPLSRSYRKAFMEELR